ncbi:transposase [Singulisphaera sp. Ch08]
MAGRPKSRAALRPDEDIGPVVRHDSHRRHVGEAAGLGAKDQGLGPALDLLRRSSLSLQCFDFTRSHKRDGPSLFLKGFRGYLQADAFSGYDGIYAGGNVVEVGCNAHARRKFVEAQKTDLTRRVRPWPTTASSTRSRSRSSRARQAA